MKKILTNCVERDQQREYQPNLRNQANIREPGSSNELEGAPEDDHQHDCMNKSYAVKVIPCRLFPVIRERVILNFIPEF